MARGPISARVAQCVLTGGDFCLYNHAGVVFMFRYSSLQCEPYQDIARDPENFSRGDQPYEGVVFVCCLPDDPKRSRIGRYDAQCHVQAMNCLYSHHSGLP